MLNQEDFWSCLCYSSLPNLAWKDYGAFCRQSKPKSIATKCIIDDIKCTLSFVYAKRFNGSDGHGPGLGLVQLDSNLDQ